MCFSVFALAKKQTAVTPEVETMTDFYKCYLDFSIKKHPKTTAEKFCQEKTPIFSADARQLLEENRSFCAKIAPNEICGFGADGDIFLDAQDYADGLNFEKSRFKAESLKNHEVEVKFDIFPGEKPEVSETKIRFKMVHEKTGWKIDDMTYLKSKPYTMRETIKNEMESLKNEVKK